MGRDGELGGIREIDNEKADEWNSFFIAYTVYKNAHIFLAHMIDLPWVRWSKTLFPLTHLYICLRLFFMCNIHRPTRLNDHQVNAEYGIGHAMLIQSIWTLQNAIHIYTVYVGCSTHSFPIAPLTKTHARPVVSCLRTKIRSVGFANWQICTHFIDFC